MLLVARIAYWPMQLDKAFILDDDAVHVLRRECVMLDEQGDSYARCRALLVPERGEPRLVDLDVPDEQYRRLPTAVDYVLSDQ